MSRPIEDYGLIGDGQTAALVSRDGSIDWLCWPRFDDDACFAALLGTTEHGFWSIAPASPTKAIERRYQQDTLVLESTFETAEGAVRLIDFMPMRNGAPALVRIVEGVRGSVPMAMELSVRFDYGALPPWTEPTADGFVARIGPDLVVLRGPPGLVVRPHHTTATLTVAAGDRLVFVLQYGPSHLPPPDAIDVDQALLATQQDGRDWVRRFDDSRTEWPDMVRRSLLTLRALTHQPTGGLVAAPTTSLPEAPGGSMNWDYRYCWLRDSAFAVGALLNAGFEAEAASWRDWLLRAIAGTPAALRIMYQVDGARHLDEWTVGALPGYRYASPVRIGNAASTQHQVDVFGEVIDCLHLARQGGIPSTDQERIVIREIADHLEKVWHTEGSGVWESRGKKRHYTYSKVMAWVAFDRVLRMVKQDGDEDAEQVGRIERLKARIHDEVCRDGWNEGLGTFTQYYGGQVIDASLLLLPLVGFLPADHPKMAATIETIGRELSEGGLIRRSKADPAGPAEGTFLPCSCWMADCLSMQGRTAEARAQFERVLAVANDIGLLSEEYNVPGKHLAGNFPQALTHLAIVNTALGLCGEVLHRGGG